MLLRIQKFYNSANYVGALGSSLDTWIDQLTDDDFSALQQL